MAAAEPAEQPAPECLYSVLGVEADASPRTIERAWKRQALAHHPDKVPEGAKEAAEARFKEVANAHEILADPERRRLYDTYGPSMQPEFPEMGPAACREAQDFEAALFEAMLRAMGAPRRRERPAPTLGDFRDGLLGFGILIGAVVAWWAMCPLLGRSARWLWWQWRFLLHDLGAGRRVRG